MQQELWRQVVSSEPADQFKTAALRQLLRVFCQHVGTAQALAKLIDDFRQEWLCADDGLARYEVLLKLRDRETKAAASLATKLRLTNQSRYTPQAAGTASRNSSSAGLPPWEKHR
jgi:hypothetical protein